MYHKILTIFNFKIKPEGHPHVGAVILFPAQAIQFAEVEEQVAHQLLQAGHEANPVSKYPINLYKFSFSPEGHPHVGIVMRFPEHNIQFEALVVQVEH